MSFWERVELARIGQGTTYRWIAENVIHKSETTVSGWRSQKVLPRADDAVAIARALGTTVEELVTGENKSLPPQRLRTLFRDIAALPEQDIYDIEALVSAKLARHQADSKHA